MATASVNFVGESAKVVVSGAAGITLLLQSQSWKPLYYIFGGVINAILSKVLKNIFKIPRPKDSGEDGYGMPSSHAQSLFYFFSIVATSLLQENVSLYKLAIVGLLAIYALLAR